MTIVSDLFLLVLAAENWLFCGLLEGARLGGKDA